MSEAFDNVAVMILLHQKIMRDAEVATAYQLMLANPEEEEPRKKKRKHKWWFRPMLHPLMRAQRGQYHTLTNELRENDKRKFKNYSRLSPEMFDELLIRHARHLQKDTHLRKAISPGLKLCVFLRHLATGATYAELGYNFRVGKETIQKFVPDVARAIVDEYAAEVISLPTTNEAWLEVAGDFEARWNLPHCLGALDGKHIGIQKPKKSGKPLLQLQAVLLCCPDGPRRFKVPVPVDRCGWGWASI